MAKLKNIISFFVCIALIAIVIINKDYIVEQVRTIIYSNREVITTEGNDWEKKYDFKYLRKTDNFIPENYKDLVNIFYTTLNKGWNNFTFYCHIDYKDCLEDVSSLSYDEDFLSEINNFVHPYNSYSTIRTEYDDTGRVTLKVDKLYSKEEISQIDKDINKLMQDNLNDNMSKKEKIKVMHDLIINNTRYDKVKEETNKSTYDSSRINGVLYNHYAICSGYTDTMAVILTKLGIKNFKVSSQDHVWNALYLDNNWYHLDLTWDDPVTTSGDDVLTYTYFIVNDNELTKLNLKESKGEHTYNKNIYLEFNK